MPAERRARKLNNNKTGASGVAAVSVSTCCTVVTGGLRLGIMIALLKCRAEWGTTERRAAPSLTCRCQSSGRIILKESAKARTSILLASRSRMYNPGSFGNRILSLEVDHLNFITFH